MKRPDVALRNKNTKQSKETIEKRVSQFRGSKHWNWNSGLKNPNSSGGKIRYWKKETMKRDNYTCRFCGIDDKDVLEIDHIKSKSLYPLLMYDIDNLITLCANCHRKKTKQDRESKQIKFRSKKIKPITLLQA